MAEIGKTLIAIGVLLLLVGAAMVIAPRIGLPIGRLPGDLHWRSRSGNAQVYFPLATSVLLSVLLTLVLWILRSFRR